MLSVAEEYIKELNPDAKPVVFGQELNPESYAICKSDMLIKGQDVSNIKFGNSFTVDGLKGEQFDYMLSNPPLGVEWKKVQSHIQKEHDVKGYAGRFGAGLPPISDGSFLFLQHMISKMQEVNGGSRIGIVFNGSPLFSGGAGSGESNIRKWIIENDMLEAIIALPDQLFYNTGIFTYVWVLTNRKTPERIDRLDDETAFANLAQSKRKGAAGQEEMEAGRQLQADIKAMLQALDSGKCYKNRDAFDAELKAAIKESGLKISAPLKNAIMKALSERDETADICTDGKGNPEPDTALRDYENVPLKMDISEYFQREVLPHVPDAWIDESRTVKGYEISFTRYFYKYKPLRSLADIRTDILALEEETEGMISEILDAK
jgi:type I restriction enzyme M protein